MVRGQRAGPERQAGRGRTLTAPVAVDIATAAPPPVQDVEGRRAELRAMKRRATGLLVVVSVVFVGLILFGSDAGLGGFLRAGAEASMVGGLADWFAVTALFRRPLGLPIPHTAVIRERKDQFGATLGAFVQENFLSPEVLGARVRAARVGHRLGAWLAEPDNAATVAQYATDIAVRLLDVVHDDEVSELIEEQLRLVVDDTPLAPLAGRALDAIVSEGRHQEVLDAALKGAHRFLEDNQESLRVRFGEKSPWWLPGAVEDRIFERLLDGARAFVQAVNENPHHEARRLFDERVRAFVNDLKTSPDLQARGEQLKQDLLARPELRGVAIAVWDRVQTSFRAQAADAESPLRTRLSGALVALGERVQHDPPLEATINDATEGAARYVAEHFHGELAALVSGTIARWDGQQTSDRLELLLGRDLQFIRINGTVVGALAGVVIHAIALALG